MIRKETLENGTNVYVRTYQDDDFGEKGYAYEISLDEAGGIVFENGHTQEHYEEDAMYFASELAYFGDNAPIHRKMKINSINKWFYFSMNYPDGFIESVWGHSSIAEHLKGKFDYLYEKYGSTGVIPAFYAELDWTNRKKLVNWVLLNYKDEQKVPY